MHYHINVFMITLSLPFIEEMILVEVIFQKSLTFASFVRMISNKFNIINCPRNFEWKRYLDEDKNNDTKETLWFTKLVGLCTIRITSRCEISKDKGRIKGRRYIDRYTHTHTHKREKARKGKDSNDRRLVLHMIALSLLANGERSRCSTVIR